MLFFFCPWKCYHHFEIWLSYDRCLSCTQLHILNRFSCHPRFCVFSVFKLSRPYDTSSTNVPIWLVIHNGSVNQLLAILKMKLRRADFGENQIRIKFSWSSQGGWAFVLNHFKLNAFAFRQHLLVGKNCVTYKELHFSSMISRFPLILLSTPQCCA